MATKAKRRRRARSLAPSDFKIFLLLAFAAAVIMAWLPLHSVWRRSNERAARSLSMQEARRTNASIPFVAGQGRAKPFHFHGSPASREQAVQCLATAAAYEAGDDERGQQAVMQVVLNRVGRPEYPKTVCGVVYQGAARPTGCQFSFACDGSQVRRPERAEWPEARAAARRALSGYVFAPVGLATHYHADWIVPYWIGSLDKIAQVNTHIFYRPRQHAET
jgi:spore germination cell wall hydrolase CwlJ-like protein